MTDETAVQDPSSDTSYAAKVWENLKLAYEDQFTVDKQKFIERIESDPKYAAEVHKNLKQAFQDEFTVEEGAFVERLKKKVQPAPGYPQNLPGSGGGSLPNSPSQLPLESPSEPAVEGVYPGPQTPEEEIPSDKLKYAYRWGTTPEVADARLGDVQQSARKEAELKGLADQYDERKKQEEKDRFDEQVSKIKNELRYSEKFNPFMDDKSLNEEIAFFSKKGYSSGAIAKAFGEKTDELIEKGFQNNVHKLRADDQIQALADLKEQGHDQTRDGGESDIDKAATDAVNTRISLEATNSFTPDQLKVFNLNTQINQLYQKAKEDPKNFTKEDAGKIAELRQQSKDIKDNQKELYDPLTEKLTEATPAAIKFDQQTDKLSQQYQATFKDKLQDLRNEKYYKFKYLSSLYDDKAREVLQPMGTATPEQKQVASRIKTQYLKAKMELDAANRALLLNEDPSGIQKGALTEIGQETKKTLLQGLPIIGSMFPEGVTSMNDRDYIDSYQKIISEESQKGKSGVMQITPAQAERYKHRFSERLGEGLGGAMAVIPEFMAYSALLETGAGAIGLAQVVSKLKTSGSLLKKAAAFLIDAGLEEVKFQAVGSEPGAGVGFAAAGRMIPKFVPKGKLGAALKPFVDSLVQGGAGMTAGMAGSAAVEDAVKAIQGTKEWNDFLKEKYGDENGNVTLSSAAQATLIDAAIGTLFGFAHAAGKKGSFTLNPDKLEKLADELDAVGRNTEAQELKDKAAIFRGFTPPPGGGPAGPIKSDRVEKVEAEDVGTVNLEGYEFIVDGKRMNKGHFVWKMNNEPKFREKVENGEIPVQINESGIEVEPGVKAQIIEDFRPQPKSKETTEEKIKMADQAIEDISKEISDLEAEKPSFGDRVKKLFGIDTQAHIKERKQKLDELLRIRGELEREVEVPTAVKNEKVPPSGADRTPSKKETVGEPVVPESGESPYKPSVEIKVDDTGESVTIEKGKKQKISKINMDADGNITSVELEGKGGKTVIDDSDQAASITAGVEIKKLEAGASDPSWYSIKEISDQVNAMPEPSIEDLSWDDGMKQINSIMHDYENDTNVKAAMEGLQQDYVLADDVDYAIKWAENAVKTIEGIQTKNAKEKAEHLDAMYDFLNDLYNEKAAIERQGQTPADETTGQSETPAGDKGNVGKEETEIKAVLGPNYDRFVEVVSKSIDKGLDTAKMMKALAFNKVTGGLNEQDKAKVEQYIKNLNEDAIQKQGPTPVGPHENGNESPGGQGEGPGVGPIDKGEKPAGEGGEKEPEKEDGKKAIKVFRGVGKPKEEIYRGVQVPIAGEGKYYAFTQEDAKNYGDKIEESQITLSNPLIIESDDQWRALTKEAGWSFPNIIAQPEQAVRRQTDDLKKLILSKDHDGLIVRWNVEAQKKGYDGDGEVYFKTLVNVFGHPTLVDYRDNNGQEAAEDYPVSGTKPVGQYRPEAKKGIVSEGNKTMINFINGKRHKARFVIAKVKDVLPSHNPKNFAKTKGYPVDEKGNTTNDRNYELDKPAQATVGKYSSKPDPNALLDTSTYTMTGPPMITEDLFVVGGNNRQMVIMNMSDADYKMYYDELKDRAEMFGVEVPDFDNENRVGLYRMDMDAEQYSKANSAMYNEEPGKGKDEADEAISLSSKLNENKKVFNAIADRISEHETFSELFASKGAVKYIREMLVNNGIIDSKDLNKYFDKDGDFSAQGKIKFRNALFSSVFDEDILRLWDTEGVTGFINKIESSLPVIVANLNLGNELSLKNELQDAIRLQHDFNRWAKSSKVEGKPDPTILDYIRNAPLFGKPTPESVYLWMLINSSNAKNNRFKASLISYNNSASQKPGMFDEGAPKTKQEFLTLIKKYLSNDEQKLVESALAIPEPPGGPKEGGGQGGGIAGQGENKPSPPGGPAGGTPKDYGAKGGGKKEGEVDPDDLFDQLQEPQQNYQLQLFNTDEKADLNQETKGTDGSDVRYHSKFEADAPDTTTGKVRKQKYPRPYKPSGVEDIEINMERQINKKEGVSYMGVAKINGPEDVAVAFRHLESAVSENVFALYERPDGSYNVLYCHTGGTTQSIVDAKLIAAGAKEFQAKKVWLIHNHPSGNLKPSGEVGGTVGDIPLHRMLYRLLNGSGAQLMPGVIINTDSGQYSIFNGEERIHEEKSYGDQKPTVPFDVYEFDKQIFYTPSAAKHRITRSKDVAEFLSVVKRGSVPKLGVMIVDRFNKVNRYSFIDPAMSENKAIDAIVYLATKSGEAIILVSNSKISKSLVDSLRDRIKQSGISILDVVEVSQDPGISAAYKSWADEGEELREPEQNYSANRPIADKIVSAFIQKGTYSFPEIIDRAYARIGAEKLRSTFPAIKDAYEDYYISADDAVSARMDDIDALNSFDLDKYIDSKQAKKPDLDEIEKVSPPAVPPDPVTDEKETDDEIAVNPLRQAYKDFAAWYEREYPEDRFYYDVAVDQNGPHIAIGGRPIIYYNDWIKDQEKQKDWKEKKKEVNVRPPLVVVDKDEMPTPSDHVKSGKYAIDEDQRLAVNLILDRFAAKEKTGNAFLLGDGTGVGKTRTELVSALEMANKTGKPSLIITQNVQIIDGFKSEMEALGFTADDMKKVEIGTYDGLKSGKAGGGNYGVVIFDEAHKLKHLYSGRSKEAVKINADNTIFATATPMDTPVSAAYIIPQLLGISEDDAAKRLGYTVNKVINKDGSITRIPTLNKGATWPKAQVEVIKIRDELIKAGAMIRREYPFFGSLHNVDVKFSPKQWNAYHELLEDLNKNSIKGMYAAQVISRWAQWQKFDYVMNEAMKAIADGKKPVIFSDSVNDVTVKKTDMVIPGFLNEAAKFFEQKGITVAKVYGAETKYNKKADQVRIFQDNTAMVFLSTPNSGGAGINADDVVGDKPREVIIVTPPYSGIEADQIFGRTSRRNTKSPTVLRMVYMLDTPVEEKRKSINEKKLKILRAIQAGADPDVASMIEWRPEDYKEDDIDGFDNDGNEESSLDPDAVHGTYIENMQSINTGTTPNAEPFIVSVEVKKLLEELGVPVAENYISSKQLGVYKHMSKNIRVRALFDTFVAAHEGAHYIDFSSGISDAILANNDPIIKSLTDIYVDNYPGAKNTHPKRKRVVEGIAVLIERYFADPTHTARAYPDLVREFISPSGTYYNPKFTQLLDGMSEIAKRFNSLTPMQRIGARVRSGDEIVKKNTGSPGYGKRQRIMEELINSNEPLRFLDKIAGTEWWNRDPASAGKSIEAQYINYNNRAAFVNSLVNGMGLVPDKNGNFTPTNASMEGYMKHLKKGNDASEFSHYLIARRTVADYNEMCRHKAEVVRLERILNGLLSANPIDQALVDAVGSQIRFHQEKADAIESILNRNNINVQESIQVVDDNEVRFAKAASGYDDVNKALLVWMLNTGKITAKQYHIWESKEGYARFLRYIDDDYIEQAIDAMGGRSDSKLMSTLRYRGSQKDIVDPIYGQALAIREVVKKGLENMVWVRIAKLAAQDHEVARRFELMPYIALKDRKGKITFQNFNNSNQKAVYINGKVSFWKMAPELRRWNEHIGLQGVPNDVFTMLFVNLPTRVFQTSTTGYYLPFAAANLSLDALSAMVNSKVGFKPLYDHITSGKDIALSFMNFVNANQVLRDSFKKITGKDLPAVTISDVTVFQKYLAMGGDKMTKYNIYTNSPEDLVAKMIGREHWLKKGASAVDSALDIALMPVNFTEWMTRYLEFKRAVEAGHSDTVAMQMAATVSAPFYRRGRLGGNGALRWIVNMMPYFNPAIQGSAQYFESSTQRPERWVGANAIIMMAGLGAAFAAFEYATEEDKQFLTNVPVEELGKYLWLPKALWGGKGYLPIRIPDFVSQYIGLTYMYVAEYYKYDKVGASRAADMMLSGLPQQLQFNKPTQAFSAWMPQSIGPAVKTGFNIRTYPEVAPIVSPYYDMRYLPEDQYSKYSSEFAKKIGAQMGWSPMKIDNYIALQFGRTASVLTGAKRVNNPFSRQASDYQMRGQQINDFYKAYEHSKQAVGSLDRSLAYMPDEEKKGVIRENILYEHANDALSLIRKIHDEGVVLPFEITDQLFKTLRSLDETDDFDSQTEAVSELWESAKNLADEHGVKHTYGIVHKDVIDAQATVKVIKRGIPELK